MYFYRQYCHGETNQMKMSCMDCLKTCASCTSLRYVNCHLYLMTHQYNANVEIVEVSLSCVLM